MTERMGISGLAFLRFVVGAWLVWLVLPNLDASFIEGLPVMLDDFARANPYPWYRWVLHHGAAPHVETLGSILSVGQLLVGAALIIGFFTRLAAGIGVFYALNMLLAAGHLSPVHQALGVVLLFVFVTFMVGDAGRYFGVDGFLFKSQPAEAPKKIKIKDKKQRQAVENLSRELKKHSKSKKRDKSAAQ